MKFIKKNDRFALRDFFILWSTQSLSQLGSSITGFALTLWLYEKTGSSLSAATLTICSYAPYVLMSIFAGALTDRFDKKKTMLGCDLFAAICTIFILVLFRTNHLMVWHLSCRNTLQFFTIPIGLFFGGFMVDHVCEPFMKIYGDLPVLKTLFGVGKGSGAALMMLILGISGSLICITTGRKLRKYKYNESEL